MTEEPPPRLTANEWAMRVQRDSAHQQLARLDAENRWLRKHQEEIRVFLADAIAQWEAARTPEAAADIHQRASELLREVRRAQSRLQ